MTNKNTNKPVVKEEVKTEVSNPVKVPPEIARELIRDARATTDPVSIFAALDKELKEYRESEGSEKDKKLKSINEKFGTATYIFALDNHYAASDTVKEEYRPMVIEIANQIATEYKCTTATEKALADIAASSYARYHFEHGTFEDKTLILRTLGSNFYMLNEKLCVDLIKPFFIFKNNQDLLNVPFETIENPEYAMVGATNGDLEHWFLKWSG